MNNLQIESLLKKHPKTKNIFKGVFASDQLPKYYKPTEEEIFITNLDPIKDSGSHWVAIYRSPHNESEYFDSYGGPTLQQSAIDLLGSVFYFSL